MKRTLRKTAAFILSAAMIGSAVPLSASAVTISDNGEYVVEFRNTYSNGTIDGSEDPKTVRFHFDSDDEKVRLTDLSGTNVKYKYYTFTGWANSSGEISEVTKEDFDDKNTLIVRATFDHSYPRNSGTYYIEMDFGPGRTEELPLDIDYSGSGSALLEFPEEQFEGYTLPIPTTSDGSEFLGWLAGGYYAHDSGDTRKQYTVVTAQNMKDNYFDVLSLDAVYKKKATPNDTTETFTLDANGGTIDGKASETYVKCIGDDYNPQDISLFIPENEDKKLKFVCWNTEKDGTGYSITHTGFKSDDFEDDGKPGWCDIFRNFGDKNGNVTLYAKWAKDPLRAETDSDMDITIAEKAVRELNAYKEERYSIFEDDVELADTIWQAAENDKDVTIGFVIKADTTDRTKELDYLKNASYALTNDSMVSSDMYEIYIAVKVDGKEVGRIKNMGGLINSFKIPVPQGLFDENSRDKKIGKLYGIRLNRAGYGNYESNSLDGVIDGDTFIVDVPSWRDTDFDTFVFVGDLEMVVEPYSNEENDIKAAGNVANATSYYRSGKGYYSDSSKKNMQKVLDAYNSGKTISARFVMEKTVPSEQQKQDILEHYNENSYAGFTPLAYFAVRQEVYADGVFLTNFTEGSGFSYSWTIDGLSDLPEQDPRYSREYAFIGVYYDEEKDYWDYSASGCWNIDGNTIKGTIYPDRSGIVAFGCYLSGEYHVTFSAIADDEYSRKSFNFLSDDERLSLKDFFGVGETTDPVRPYAKFLGWGYESGDDDEVVILDSIGKSDFENNYYLYLTPQFDDTLPKNSGTYYITLVTKSGELKNLPTLNDKVTWKKVSGGFERFTIYLGVVKSSDFSSITIPAPEAEDMQFLGWEPEFDSESGTLKTHSATVTTADFKDSDVLTLNAFYKKTADPEDLTFAAVLNANGGTIDGKSTGYYHAGTSFWYEDYNFNYLVPERAGYKFLGWNTKKDGSGEMISDAGMASMTIFSPYREPKICDADNNVLLYAQWERTSWELENNSYVSAENIVLGDTVTLNAVANYGTAPYTYALMYKKSSSSTWTKIGTKYGTESTGSFKPGSMVPYDVQINVKDSTGAVKAKKFTITVNPPLVNTSTLSSDSFTVNEPIKIYASSEGGIGKHIYIFKYKKSKSTNWSMVKTANIDGNVATFTPTSLTDYDIQVLVMDEKLHQVEKTMTISPAAALTNTSTISAETVSVGETVTLNGAARGGKGEYLYALMYKKSSSSTWTKIGTKYGTASTGSFKPGSAVPYDIMINVKDGNGTIKSKTFTLNVTKSLVNKSTINADTVTVGNKVVMKGAASGGAGTYKYAFYYKKSKNTAWTAISENTAKSAAFKPGSATSYDCKVVVTDANGTKTEKIFTVNVTK